MSEQLNLTKRTVEALPIPTEGRAMYRDKEDRFLHIVVSSEGRRTWRYVRKVAGRVRFVTVGTYPETTPDAARRESKKLSAAYDAGRDPALEKKQLRNLMTWADLFDWYLENHAKPHKRTWPYDEKMNGLYCAAWRARPYSAITAEVVTGWHKKLGKANGQHQADRVLAMVKTVYAVALEAGAIKGSNPAATVRKFFSSAKKYSRERYLSGEEIGRLTRALSAYPDRDMADFFAVCLFTGARRGNVQAMRWADMDRTDPSNPRWTIPGEVSKNGEPMAVPLLAPVLEILNRRYEDRRSEEYVFPAKRTPSKTPYLTEPKKAWATICKNAKIEHMRIHDLRRTLGSWQALLGTSLQIIGRSLGHKSIQSTEGYARMNLDPVRASMGAAVAAMLTASKGEDKKT